MYIFEIWIDNINKLSAEHIVKHTISIYLRVFFNICNSNISITYVCTPIIMHLATASTYIFASQARRYHFLSFHWFAYSHFSFIWAFSLGKVVRELAIHITNKCCLYMVFVYTYMHRYVHKSMYMVYSDYLHSMRNCSSACNMLHICV